jgi:hypothetical protein
MERDYEHERELGEYLLAKCAADLRRSHELQADMGQRTAEGARLRDEDEKGSDDE